MDAFFHADMVAVILAGAVATFLTRIGGYVLVMRMKSIPPRLEAALNAVPAAVLTTLVALEPLYIYFDVDERTLLRQLLRAGQPDLTQRGRLPIEIGLSDETGFPHPGVVNFVDNRADPNTGTMWMRGEFISPDRAAAAAVGGSVAAAAAREQLVNLSRPVKPGIFGRVRFPLGAPYEAVLVAEQALGTDQGQKFVYVVQDGKPVRRLVDVGPLKDGLRVVLPVVKKEDGSILKGLEPYELVVVNGVQRVRAGQPVRHEGDVPMASMAAGEKTTVTTKASH